MEQASGGFMTGTDGAFFVHLPLLWPSTALLRPFFYFQVNAGVSCLLDYYVENDVYDDDGGPLY